MATVASKLSDPLPEDRGHEAIVGRPAKSQKPPPRRRRLRP
jgi:hypothetical protein